jgi:superfamily II DNA or RNA helicase
MIKIIIHRGAHIENLPEDLKIKIRKDLSFDNPEYVNAKRYGKFIPQNISSRLFFYGENESGLMYVPKGYFFYLLKEIKKQNLKFYIDDRTTVFPKLDINFLGVAREYQEKALFDISKYPIGVLEAGTGSGKTVIGINMISIRKQPTLIIVHTKELLNQWTEQIKKLLGYDAGRIGDGSFDVKDITVGIVKSVQNKIEQLQDRFGFTIIDETHRCPSSTFINVLSQMSSRYQLGLSATAYRSDGLGHAIFAFIGPKIHQVDRDNLNKIGAILIPEVRRISTGFQYYYDDGIYGKMVNTLAVNIARNELIVKNIIQDLKETKSSILVVSDRVNHCEIIKNMLGEKGIDSVLLTAQVPKEERKVIVEGIKSGKDKVAIATTQLIGEGFDSPNLGSIHLTTPIKYVGKLKQVVGRILRPSENSNLRKPQIFDYRDDHIKPLKSAGKERDKMYKREWSI